MQSTVQETVRHFVVEAMLFGSDSADLPADVSLLEQGIIDSTGVLELVEFLESTYGFQVEDEELVPENLDSLQRIAAYVTRKQTSRPPTTGPEHSTPAGVETT